MTHLNFSPVAFFLRKVLGIPYWIVVHGVEGWNIPPGRLLKALCGAEKILCVSNFTRQKIIDQQPSLAPNLEILFNTVDQERFTLGINSDKLRARLGIGNSEKVILTVARLDPSEQYKGYDVVLRALSKLRADKKIRYLIVGKGGDLERVQKLIQELKLGSVATLIGFVADEELPQYYSLCDVFVMPSRGEGFGIVYLEALACGKPCIGGASDGAQDALCGGTLGQLVDPNDEQQIARAIDRVLDADPSLPLGSDPTFLRAEMLKYFGQDRFAKRVKELFEPIVS